MPDYFNTNRSPTQAPLIRIIPVLPLILFALVPLIYLGVRVLITSIPAPLQELVVIFSISSAMIIIYFVFYIIYYIRDRKLFRDIEEWYTFVNDYLRNTHDIFIILDELGQILYYNRALNAALHLKGKELIGKPFRSIFKIGSISDSAAYNRMILDKLRDIFEGNETEIVAPVSGGNEGEYVSVNLKMIPVFKRMELSKIYVTGRLTRNDYIANHWLESEQVTYMMNNNLSLIHMFCYRLTRNLESRLSPKEILFVQIAIQEVLINAVEHGNLEVGYDKKTELKRIGGNYWELLCENCDSDYLENRKVRINYELNRGKIIYIVSDDGRGFTWQNFLDDSYEPLVNDVMATFHGIGLQMVKKAFDVIEFNEKGNEIRLVKYFDGSEEYGRAVQESSANG